MVALLKEAFDKLSSDISVEWISIFEFSNERSVGITKDGYWYINISDGIIKLRDNRDFMYAEAILEQSLETVQRIINSVINELMLNIEAFDFFPFLDIARFPLEHTKSNYWIGLSLNWISKMPTERAALLRSQLLIISTDKSLSQNIRQRALEVIKNI